MKARQILFNTEMVNAILDGRKMQTRRPVKPQPQPHYWEIFRGYKKDMRLMDTSGGLYAKFTDFLPRSVMEARDTDESVWSRSPFGKPGDLLYVREKFCVGAVVCSDNSNGGQEEWYIDQCENDNNIIPYQVAIQEDFGIEEVVWTPSIHMPRWASRITLVVKKVWVERMQDLSLSDACAEGCAKGNFSAVSNFADLWDSIYDKTFPWDSNPWVWACEFEVIEKNIDEILK